MAYSGLNQFKPEGTLKLQDNESLIERLGCFYNKYCIVLAAEVHDNVNNPKYAVEKQMLSPIKVKRIT